MLQLQSISLYQFKNYPQRTIPFHERIVGIYGRNGVGKTNLLDAIYYLCFTKSYFNKSDALNVIHGGIGFRLEGSFLLEESKQKLICILRENGKKEFSVNEELYDRLALHIGNFPAVIITPDDVQIIIGGSEERRRFIDALFSQLDRRYLQHLIDYNRVLQQRNSSLKMMAERKQFDASLLEVYDQQLITHTNYIYQVRKEKLQELIPLINETYEQIAGSKDELTISYDSQLHQASMAELLKFFREKDRISLRTHAGIHKDDLLFTLQQQPFKSIGSQGQRKSLLFALKLSEFECLGAHKGFAPLLLLDDVFEKLDEERMHNLLYRVCIENEGQVFITDTHADRIKSQFDQLKVPIQMIEIE
jgi:DNA replication and repair protein RecF